MTQWEFSIKRTDIGMVTVAAETEEEARIKARDYAERIIHVDGKAWQTIRIIKEDLVDIIEGSN